MDNETQQSMLVRGFAGLIFLIIAFLVGGTFRTEINVSPRGVSDSVTGMEFTETLHAHHWLVGLIRGKQPAVEEEVAKYVRGGERISHLTVGMRYSGTDILVSGLTLGVYCPQTVIVRGTVTPELQTAKAR